MVTCSVWRVISSQCKAESGMQGHSVYPCEGTVVRRQSKAEKAKYVHTENNLRRTLENISESFKRTNKRLSDETETLRSDLHKLRQSVEKVRQEKMKRITGDYHKKRRPYQAERFLCDENIVTLKPFSDSSSKIVTQRKCWAKKQCQRRLDPIRLHQNKLKGINDREEISKYGQQPKTLLEETTIKKAVLLKLPKIETPHDASDKPFTVKKETDGDKIKNNRNSGLQGHMIAEEKNVSLNPTRYLEVPKVPICSLMDINVFESWNKGNSMKSKPHFLPPLDKITEDEDADVE